MSNTPVTTSSTVQRTPARPVSLITIVFLFVVFAAFVLAARWFYRPATALPQDVAADNYSKDLQWRATAASRRQTLNDLRDDQQKQLTGYRWIDQGAGVVQLPVERAMELTAQKYQKK